MGSDYKGFCVFYPKWNKDYFREDDEDKDDGKLRSINHHGKSITVNQNGTRLVQTWMSGLMNNGYSKLFEKE